MNVSLEWLAALLGTPLEADRAADLLTARGLTVDDVLDGPAGSGNAVLDVDVPANRPDCLGHLGLARELAAALGRPLPAVDPLPGGGTPPIDVAIEDPDGCLRFTASVVRGVRIGPSPAWVVRRLEACGLRSVNNVVDASNLVMLELGQPVHFYDLASLHGGRIVVRAAREGERLTTLDDVERALVPADVVIADGERAIGLGGVIGGEDTEIRDSTRDVLVEAASFDPHRIRRTARRLGIATDASHRFERGVDPEAPRAAQARSARLLAELAGGEPDAACLDRLAREPSAAELALRHAEVERLLGYRPPDAEVREALARLGLRPRAVAGADSTSSAETVVTVPSWRVDLEREADLVEEVARHLGYDRIPEVSDGVSRLGFGESDPADPFLEARLAEEVARDVLAPLGFHEAYGYAMIGAGEDDAFVPSGAPAALPLANPLAETMAFLRRSILPGLLRSADRNMRHGLRDVRLFETGRVFLAREAAEALPREPVHAAIVWSGAAEPRHWSRPAADVALPDVAGVVESVLERLAPGTGWNREPEGPGALHPGRAVVWRAEPGAAPVAWAGALHPERQAALAHPLWVAELDLTAARACASGTGPRHRPLPRLGAVHRDLALVLPPDRPYRDVEAALRSVEPPVPARFEAIDRYVGPPLAPGHASLTVRVTLQPDAQALTEETIEAYRRALVERLAADLGIEIRS